MAGAEGAAGLLLVQGMETEPFAQSLYLYVTCLVADRGKHGMYGWRTWEDHKELYTLPVSPYGFFGVLHGPYAHTPSLKDLAVAFQAPSSSSGFAAPPSPSRMGMPGEEFLLKQTPRWQGSPVSISCILAFSVGPELASEENNTYPGGQDKHGLPAFFMTSCHSSQPSTLFP